MFCYRKRLQQGTTSWLTLGTIFKKFYNSLSEHNFLDPFDQKNSMNSISVPFLFELYRSKNDDEWPLKLFQNRVMDRKRESMQDCIRGYGEISYIKVKLCQGLALRLKLYRYANLPYVACFVLLQHSDVNDFFSTCNAWDFEIDTIFLPFRLIVRFSCQYRDLVGAMLLSNSNLAARFHRWFLSYLKGAAFAVH
uniref:Uncharacterized protein n=1 Tax=Glossina austeni TaxID=7395 RepID=A0A1A9VQI5_GLOAU